MVRKPDLEGGSLKFALDSLFGVLDIDHTDSNDCNWLSLTGCTSFGGIYVFSSGVRHLV